MRYQGHWKRKDIALGVIKCADDSDPSETPVTSCSLAEFIDIPAQKSVHFRYQYCLFTTKYMFNVNQSIALSICNNYLKMTLNMK